MKVALLVGLLLVADNATEASVRFKRGLALYQKGDLREALEQFLVSYRLSPNPNLAYNIATCFEQLGNADAAFSAYTEYLAFDALSEAEKKEGEAALALIIPKVARLEVVTEPPGAAIYLDRETLGQYGVSPRTFAAPPGQHELIVTLGGYVTSREKVELRKGALVRLRVELTRKRGQVDVTTTPAGALIRLEDAEGTVLGTSPTLLSLPIGTHRLHLRRDGHLEELRTILVEEKTTSRVRVGLRPLPKKRGRLRILTNVPQALISVDGREAGFSPLVLELPEGEHGVSVFSVGYRPWTKKLAVSSERLLAAEVTLQPKEQSQESGVWPWVLLATTAAAGVTALGLSIEAIRNRVAFPDDPTRSRFDRTQTLNIASDVMWVVTLLGGTATALTFWLQPTQAELDSSAEVTEVDQLVEPRPRVP